MNPNFVKYLQNFVATEHPYAPKLSAYCVGGGSSLALLSTIPGASKLVSGIYLPYDKEVVATEIDEMLGSSSSNRYMEKAVQARVALDLAEIARRKNPDGVGVGVTAALTTSRFRKGDNHAYIAFTESDYKIATVYHVTWDKIPEDQHDNNLPMEHRALEDEQIARLILSIVYGFGNDLFDKMRENGMIEDVS